MGGSRHRAYPRVLQARAQLFTRQFFDSCPKSYLKLICCVKKKWRFSVLGQTVGNRWKPLEIVGNRWKPFVKTENLSHFGSAKRLSQTTGKGRACRYGVTGKCANWWCGRGIFARSGPRAIRSINSEPFETVGNRLKTVWKYANSLVDSTSLGAQRDYNYILPFQDSTLRHDTI